MLYMCEMAEPNPSEHHRHHLDHHLKLEEVLQNETSDLSSSNVDENVDSKKNMLHHELKRIMSFPPHVYEKYLMAHEGFYFKENMYKCYFCSIEISIRQFEKRDRIASACYRHEKETSSFQYMKHNCVDKNLKKHVPLPKCTLMYIELHRISSFFNKQRSCSLDYKSVRNIVKSGFFLTERKNETECYLCGLRRLDLHLCNSTDNDDIHKFREWDEQGEQQQQRNNLLNFVRLEHFRFSPECDAILEDDIVRTTKRAGSEDWNFSNNVPFNWDTMEEFDPQRALLFEGVPPTPSQKSYEIDRRADLYVHSLSLELDRVMRDRNVLMNDKFFPKRMSYCDRSNVMSKPIYKSFVDVDDRLKTYKDVWPARKIHSAEQAAEAGFFYDAISDTLTCFYCNLVVRTVLPTETMWQVHARGGSWDSDRSLRCFFVEIHRGPLYFENFFEVEEIRNAVAVLKNVRPLRNDMVVKKARFPLYEEQVTHKCKICKSNKASVVNLPCAHLVACEHCIVLIENKKCTMCNKYVISHMPVKMP